MGEFVMHRLFPIVCNMSLTASVVILAVLAVRLLLRRAPKAVSYTHLFLQIRPPARWPSRRPRR